LSLSDHEELVIESPEPSRWRLGGYTSYTGSGWEQRDAVTNTAEGRIPTAEGTPDSPAYDIRVTTRRPFRALATVWRPAFAAAPNRNPAVTSEGGVVVDDRLESGETYVTATYGPPSTTTASSSTASPPLAIRDRYTQLPEDTPPELAEFTSELTADAETPYESAVAIESWLERNKSYSLEASHDPDNDVASEFVFEMDAGYCQYFATSMAAMLRTQGIPARYVTGYGVGEQIDDDTYLVRGKDAHAWVEVYIGDVGWVSFDPTPADGRVDASRDSTRLEDPTADGETGTPGEPTDAAEQNDRQQASGDSDEPNESQPDEARETPDDDGEDASERDSQGEDEETNESDSQSADESEDDSGGDERTPPLEISVPGEPVPGRELVVNVTRDGAPVSGATVSFNGDVIGETDASGNVAGEVPYNASLKITAELGDDTDTDTDTDARPREAAPASGRIANELSWLSDGGQPTATAAMSNVTVDVPTTVDIETLGTPVADESVGVLATITGEPVSNATVRVNGTETARTDAAGQSTIDIPGANTVEVVVRRGDAEGTMSVEPVEFDLETDPSTVVALPLTEVTATATLDDEPVENATVAVDGRDVGVTDASGTVTAELPVANSATVEATARVGRAAPSATVTVEHMYRNLALVASAALLVISIVVLSARRRGVTAGSIARSTRRVAVRAVQLTLAGIVSIAALGNSGLSAIVAGGRRALSLLSDGIEGVAKLLSAVPQRVAKLSRRFAVTIRTLPNRVDPRAIVTALRRPWVTTATSVTADGQAAAMAERGLTVREVWTEFREHVSIRSWRTSTPGEIARWAIDTDGLPRDAVVTITDAFREVEYGGRSADSRAPAARDALESIEAVKRRESDGETDADGDAER
jgi:transglutaminase-like putative cysteine protease